LSNLPKDIQKQARKSYRLWKEDHHHSSLQFKQVSQKQSIYSVRVNLGYRALGLIADEEIYWFWIGPHSEYDQLLKRL
jgi:hypothetical protein